MGSQAGLAGEELLVGDLAELAVLHAPDPDRAEGVGVGHAEGEDGRRRVYGGVVADLVADVVGHLDELLAGQSDHPEAARPCRKRRAACRPPTTAGKSAWALPPVVSCSGLPPLLPRASIDVNLLLAGAVRDVGDLPAVRRPAGLPCRGAPEVRVRLRVTPFSIGVLKRSPRAVRSCAPPLGGRAASSIWSSAPASWDGRVSRPVAGEAMGEVPRLLRYGYRRRSGSAVDLIGDSAPRRSRRIAGLQRAAV